MAVTNRDIALTARFINATKGGIASFAADLREASKAIKAVSGDLAKAQAAIDSIAPKFGSVANAIRELVNSADGFAKGAGSILRMANAMNKLGQTSSAVSFQKLSENVVQLNQSLLNGQGPLIFAEKMNSLSNSLAHTTQAARATLEAVQRLPAGSQGVQTSRTLLQAAQADIAPVRRSTVLAASAAVGAAVGETTSGHINTSGVEQSFQHIETSGSNLSRAFDQITAQFLKDSAKQVAAEARLNRQTLAIGGSQPRFPNGPGSIGDPSFVATIQQGFAQHGGAQGFNLNPPIPVIPDSYKSPIGPNVPAVLKNLEGLRQALTKNQNALAKMFADDAALVNGIKLPNSLDANDLEPARRLVKRIEQIKALIASADTLPLPTVPDTKAKLNTRIKDPTQTVARDYETTQTAITALETRVHQIRESFDKSGVLGTDGSVIRPFNKNDTKGLNDLRKEYVEVQHALATLRETPIDTTPLPLPRTIRPTSGSGVPLVAARQSPFAALSPDISNDLRAISEKEREIVERLRRIRQIFEKGVVLDADGEVVRPLNPSDVRGLKALEKEYKDLIRALQSMNSASISEDLKSLPIYRGRNSASGVPLVQAPKALPEGFGTSVKFETPDTTKLVTFQQGVDKIKGSVSSLKSEIFSLTSIIGTAFTIDKILHWADEYTTVNAQIRTVTDSVGEQNAVFNQLFTISQTTRQGLEGITQTYTRISRASEELGLSQSRLLGITETVAKVLAIQQAPSRANAAALYELSEAFNAGSLAGRQFRSLQIEAPLLLKTLAKGLGVTSEELQHMAHNGGIAIDDLVRGFENGSKGIDATFSKIPLTVRGALTKTDNAITQFVGKLSVVTESSSSLAKSIDEALKIFDDPEVFTAFLGAMDTLGKGLKMVVEGVVFLVEHFNELIAVGAGIAAFFGARFLFTFAEGLSTAAAGALNFGSRLKSIQTAAAGATGAVRALGIAGAALEVFGGPIAIAIGLASAAMLLLNNHSKDLSSVLAEAEAALSKFDAALREVGGDASKLGDAFKSRSLIELQAELAKTNIKVKETGVLLKDLTRTDFNVSSVLPDFLNANPFTTSGAAGFQAEIEALRKSVQAGTPDLIAFNDAINKKISEHPELASAGQAMQDLIAPGLKASETAKKLYEDIKKLEGPFDLTKGAGKTVAVLEQEIKDAEKKIREGVPALHAADTNDDKRKEAEDRYQKAVKATNELNAQDPNPVHMKEREETLKRMKGELEENIYQTSGLADAEKKLQDFIAKGNEKALQGRERALQTIEEDYQKTVRTLNDTRLSDPKSSERKEFYNKELEAIQRSRDAQTSHVDDAFNKDFTERLEKRRQEIGLVGLTGQALDRQKVVFDALNEATKYYGTEGPEAQRKVAEYVQRTTAAYDELVKRQHAAQNIGQGITNAVTKYVEDAQRIAETTEKIFDGLFQKMEDTFVDFVKTGKFNWQDLISYMGEQLLRASFKSLMSDLLGNLFGVSVDAGGKTNTAAGGGLLGPVLSAFGIATGGTKGSTANNNTSQISAITALGNSAAGATVANQSSTVTDAITNLGAVSKVASTSISNLSVSSQDYIQYFSDGLKKLGVTNPEAIKGVIGGTIGGESNYNPLAYNDKSGARGLFQDLGSRSPGGQGDGFQQIDYALKEFSTTERASLELAKKATTVQEGVIAGLKFERPSPSEIASSFDKRVALGNQIDTKLVTSNLDSKQISDTVSKIDTSVSESVTKASEKVSQDFQTIGGDITGGVDGFNRAFKTGGSETDSTFQTFNTQLKTDFEAIHNTLGSASQSSFGKAGGTNIPGVTNAPQQAELTRAGLGDIPRPEIFSSKYVPQTEADLNPFGLGDLPQVGQSFTSQFGSALNGITSSTQGVGTNFTGGFGGLFESLLGSVGGIFKGFGGALSSVLSGAVGLISKLFSALSGAGGGSSGGGGLLGSLFSGATSLFSGGASSAANLGAFLYHTGGTAGVLSQSGKRSVSPELFENAPKFHEGLRPNEYPAILLKGEQVLTEQETQRTADLIKSFSERDIPKDGSWASAHGALTKPVTIVQNISTPDPGAFRRSEASRNAKLGNAVRRSMDKFS
jgi:tape measure domain-containing protein